jgi:hypothetical protein
LIRQRATVSVLGNHDQAALNTSQGLPAVLAKRLSQGL